MKKLFFYLLLSLPLLSFAQVPAAFNLNGKFGNLNARIYLGYQVGSNRVLDSTQIVNGSFQFKGDLIYPSYAILIIDYKAVGAAKLDAGDSADKFAFYLDKGTINITSPDSAYKAQITGSPINDQYKQLMALSATASAKTNQFLMAEVKATKAGDDNGVASQNSIQAKLKAIQQDYHAALKAFVIANPTSYLSLMTLNTIGGPTPDPKELEPLFDGLSPDIKNSEVARAFKNRLESLKITAIGSMAPDFEQADTLGHMVRLSSFRGKYVLLDFWASWCAPCRQENPNVVQAYNRYKNKNFTIIGISLDRPGDVFSWLNAIKSDHLNWTQLSDLKFWNNAVAQLYMVQSIPKNFLIDPTGKIIAQDLRGDDLEAELKNVLGKI